MKHCVATGEIPWTKARIISGVATVATQGDWIREAERSNCRQLEARVRQAKLGGRRRAKVMVTQARETVQSERAEAAGEDVPTASVPRTVAATESDQPALLPEIKPLPAAESRLPVTLRFTPEQFARFEVLLETRRKQGDRSSREELLLAGMEALVGSPAEGADPAATTTESTRVQNENHYQVVVSKCPDCGCGTVATSRGDRRLNPAAVLAIECDSRVWKPGGPNRASIPPGIRRTVLVRDGFRCQAFGCERTHFLEVHHRVSRQRGGSNRPDNLITLCSGCHQQVHERELVGLVESPG
ncbi:MAG: HNH endonuclease [bacterium]